MGGNILLNSVEVRNFYSGIKPAYPNNIPLPFQFSLQVIVIFYTNFIGD
jgi:hypothetical protein